MAFKNTSVCWLLLLFVSFSLSISNVDGQIVIRAATIQPAPTPISPQSASPASPTAPGSAGGEAEPGENPPEKSEEEKLVEELLKVKFERTTQEVLKAWSYKAPQKKKKDEEKKADTFEGTTTNVIGSICLLTVEDTTKLKPDQKVIVSKDATDIGNATVLSIEGKTVALRLEATKEPAKTPAGDPNEESAEKAAKEEKKPDAEASEKKDSSSEGGDSTAKSAEPAKSDSDSSESKTDDSKAEAKAESEAKPDSTESTSDQQTDAPKKEDSKSETDTKKTAEPETELPKLAVDDKVVLRPAPKDGGKKKSNTADAKKKIETFKRQVLLGQWKDVKAFLDKLKPENASKVYAHVLTALSQKTKTLPEGIPEEMAQQLAQMNRQQPAPSSFLTPDDILSLAEISPDPIQIKIKKDDEEGEGSDAETANATPTLPPGVQLPPGVTIDSLPPEALAQFQQMQAANGGAPGGDGSAKSADDKKADHLPALGNLVRIASKSGHDFTKFIKTLSAGTKHFGKDDRIKQLTTADLLMKGGLTEEVEAFLPTLDKEETQKDLPALKIWSQLALQQHSEKKVAEWLEKAWQINQWIVAVEDVPKADKDKALSNLIELSPKVDKELGQAWLNASFTDEPERGMMILTNLGTKSATMAKNAAGVSERTRFRLLDLQNKAVENLIRVSPETAGKWAQAMTMLAQNWITEAETSLKYSKQNSRSTYMQIDMYGNYYWMDQDDFRQRYGGQRNPRPIKIGDMLEILPSQTWQSNVSSSLHTQMRRLTANLYLRVNEEDKAFPFIEQVAPEHPEIAKDLVHEFLEIWTKNHDPNTDKRQRNPYIYFYGFDQKADSIPLTRSKQERNLEELRGWVERIRKLELDIDEQKLANAFTTCHSSAEVFRLSAVKSVFGELEDLKPETVAALCQKMRANLSSNWRDVRNQEAKQTKRREPEVKQEVLRGYDVAMKIAEEALTSSKESWQLQLAKACLMYDQNAYSQTVQKTAEFSDRRDKAFLQFEKAAENYANVITTLEEKDQSTDVYDYWFYAALGACDLGKITDKTVPDLRQYPKIREAILALPGSTSEDHMAKVANNMFTRMSPIKPEIKFRYLRGGFEIVRDHPRAWEAKSLYDYYKDLVSEIKLNVAVDGDENVGHGEPFGVYVNLLHTSEIERESGGFGKYVQNQNNMMYSFNYGRPTEDYRDKFNDAVNQALEKHFEILNVTFQSADAMQSVDAPEKGWRLTPYAYILLKARGSEVDRIAPLKLDMDFLDTSGYVVIPIESPAVVIDSSDESGSERPLADLQITQTLDERQAEESRLILEVSATAKGLVPPIEKIVELKKENFEIVNIDDQGVLPNSFDKDSRTPQIVSDRSWTIEYKAKEGKGKPDSFSFGESLIAESGTKFQRYEDADLVEVDQQISLEKTYGSTSWAFLYWLIPLIGVGFAGAAAAIYFMNQPEKVERARFQVPDDVNPFTVLTLLKDIRQRNGISNDQARELEKSINRVEKVYFGRSESEKLEQELDELARTWVNQAK